MKPSIAIFCHSLESDWNHGNAHFLRGIVSELQARGHTIRVFEPEDSWSRSNLLQDHGDAPFQGFARAFPHLHSIRYRSDELESHLDRWLECIDLVLVHEWNDPAVIARLGVFRKQNRNVRIFFHDTHHRAVSAPAEMSRFDLSSFDGVLAYGQSLRAAYERLGWGRQVYVWHEAADVRVFHPLANEEGEQGSIVWVGNWGDEERSEELREFLIHPCSELSLRARVFGVRYPPQALRELAEAGIAYGGWLPNYRVPEIFASFRATVHVPRRPYIRQLPGIPTIRPFEALACGIPLVSAPWSDTEHLFRVGTDFLMAQNGREMKDLLRSVLEDAGLAVSLARHGLETIRARHTCAHRVDELLGIYAGQANTSSSLPPVEALA